MLITDAEYFFPGEIEFGGGMTSSADSSPCLSRHLATAAAVNNSSSPSSLTVRPDLNVTAAQPVSHNGPDGDASPKATRQAHRKAPAPPPPPLSTNQNQAAKNSSANEQQATRTAYNHQRSHSAHDAILTPERPNVPPPAPPKKPDKPNVSANRGDQKPAMPPDVERPPIYVSDGLKLSAVVGTAAVSHGENGDINSELSGSQSANSSTILETADLSLSTESDQSSVTSPKEDIRKMTAQLKAQWWQNSPTPGGDRTASKMTTEISGKFDPRVSSPAEHRRNNVAADLTGSDDDLCRAEPESVDVKCEDVQRNQETRDKKSDDTSSEDGRRISDEILVKQEFVSDDQTLEVSGNESEKLVDDSAVTKNVRTPPVPLPRSCLVEQDTDGTLPGQDQATLETHQATSTKQAILPSDTVLFRNLSSSTTPPATRPKPVRRSLDNVEHGPVWEESACAAEVSTSGGGVHGQATLSVETTPTGVGSTGPATRPKPAKSPPARPPPCSPAALSTSSHPPLTSPAELHADTSTPPLPTRRPSLGVPGDLPSADVTQKPRTLERFRPEKPPPPLPRTPRTVEPSARDTPHSTLPDIAQVTVEQPAVLDISDDAGLTETAAIHDEHTYL